MRSSPTSPIRAFGKSKRLDFTSSIISSSEMGSGNAGNNLSNASECDAEPDEERKRF